LFDVCEQRALDITIGDKLFARSANKKGKVVNGERIDVTAFDKAGNIIDQCGRTVEHRNLCYAYASTVHKSQGSSILKVIPGYDRHSTKYAGRDDAYVAIGRGREDCRVYVESKLDLAQIQNRNGSRKLATDMPVIALSQELQALKEQLEPKAKVELSHDHHDGRSLDYNHDHGHEMSIGHDL
jgi:ATP-dependent exoDNAse (exonuclease V) alpha subunit